MNRPELGWRAWGIGEDEHGPLLTSRDYTRAVLPGTDYPTMPAEARCAWQRCDPDHIPPDPDCTCGLYFTWDRFTVENRVFPNPFNRGAKVLGQVRPIGPVLTVPHEQEGVPDEQRAGALTLAGEQLVTPVVPAATIQALSDRYNITFRPAPELLTPRPSLGEEAWYSTLAAFAPFFKAAGLPSTPEDYGMAPTRPGTDYPWDPDAWNPPTKALQRAQRSHQPDHRHGGD